MCVCVCVCVCLCERERERERERDRRRGTEVEEARIYQMMINYIQRGKWNPALYSQGKVLKEKCIRFPPTFISVNISEHRPAGKEVGAFRNRSPEVT